MLLEAGWKAVKTVHVGDPGNPCQPLELASASAGLNGNPPPFVGP